MISRIQTFAILTSLALLTSHGIAQTNDPHTGRPLENAQAIAVGKDLFVRACSHCHGTKGTGKGPVAYFLSRDTAPRPRDFTAGVFKFRSTPSGDLPTDEDLMRTITRGVPGYMPAYAGLDTQDRWRLVYYIKGLYSGFRSDIQGQLPKPIPLLGTPMSASPNSLRRGYQVYHQLKCWECHGDNAQGDGNKAHKLKDDWGLRLPPSDLTRASALKNGAAPVDLYRSIMAGLDGGAMPSYQDSFEGREDDIWHLINYLQSLSR